MDLLLSALKACAEPTRLRLLALCAEGELTVSDFTHILGQSQPRVSRHLKLLTDAGLIERHREGTWAWFRLAETGEAARLVRAVVAALPPDDRVLQLDRERFDAIRQARSAAAARYFRNNAAAWDRMRSLHVPEREVEAVLLQLLDQTGETGETGELGDLLDIGTGTGRMLELLGPRARRAVGIDQSREMLVLARAKLEQAGLRHCQVRQGDMYQLPLSTASVDAAIIHQVLHYAEQPARVIAEAARVLRPGGRLLVVDFARHELDLLREQHAHRRLGFDEAEVAAWCRQAGLEPAPVVHLAGNPLTVTIWPARRLAGPATVPVVPVPGFGVSP